jgi:hypothetical protein
MKNKLKALCEDNNWTLEAFNGHSEGVGTNLCITGLVYCNRSKMRLCFCCTEEDTAELVIIQLTKQFKIEDGGS